MTQFTHTSKHNFLSHKQTPKFCILMPNFLNSWHPLCKVSNLFENFQTPQKFKSLSLQKKQIIKIS
jgi:hypothetical protein